MTSEGEVISCWHGDWKTLSGGQDKDGYRKFVLIDDLGARRYVRRSSLICSAFHGPRPKGKEVRHLDGTRLNDRPDNLTWATHKENCADKEGHGTVLRGERANGSKISEAQARKVLDMWKQGSSVREIMAATGVSRGNCYNIKYRKTWAWIEGES